MMFNETTIQVSYAMSSGVETMTDDMRKHGNFPRKTEEKMKKNYHFCGWIVDTWHFAFLSHGAIS